MVYSAWTKPQQACVFSVSKSILLVKRRIIWAQSAADGAKRWYLDSELVMGVFWSAHKSNQSASHLPLSFGCARTCHMLNSSIRLHWGEIMWSSAAGPSAPLFHNHLSQMKKYTDIKLRRTRSAAASLHLCMSLSQTGHKKYHPDQ